ncbi:MAG: hypothetical protein JWN04_1107 [Myxococcaceae bacterium]|nr:hypothetical protein [Myxococcaceae bacterium]
MVRSPKAPARSPSRTSTDLAPTQRSPSFRAEVSKLIHDRGYTTARETFDALAKDYPALTAAQKTTIYGVLKDLGYGRAPKPAPAPRSAESNNSSRSLAMLIAEADPATIRNELATLRDQQSRVARSIKALEMLLGE